ncbi:hypothetical protein DOY81_000444, partial [Sarcophaga bullata]
NTGMPLMACVKAVQISFYFCESPNFNFFLTQKQQQIAAESGVSFKNFATLVENKFYFFPNKKFFKINYWQRLLYELMLNI